VFAGDLNSASAALVGPEAPIVIEPTRGTYLADPVSAGEEGTYMDSLFQSYSHYRRKHPQFATKSGVAKAKARANSTAGGKVQFRPPSRSSSASSSDESEFPMSSAFDYMILHDKRGQIPTGPGAIYAGLANLVKDSSPEKLKGKSVGVFGFANSTSTFFSVRVAGDCTVIRKRLLASA
jgi:hypothetical protein